MKNGWARNGLILCGTIGVLMAMGIIGLADVLKEYSIIICIALLVWLLVVGIFVAAVANAKGAMKPPMSSEAEEKEFQERESLREDTLKTAHDTLSFFAEEGVNAGRIIVQRRGDSIIAYVVDATSPTILFAGTRGLPVVHFSIRVEEEKDRRIEVFCGSYALPPTCFSLERRWDALKLATDYVQTLKLPEE